MNSKHAFVARHPGHPQHQGCLKCGRTAQDPVHAEHTPEETVASARAVLSELMASFPRNTRQYAALVKAITMMQSSRGG